MALGPNRSKTRAKTPNCVLCSQAREHTICQVLRLVDDHWIFDQQPLAGTQASASATAATYADDEVAAVR